MSKTTIGAAQKKAVYSAKLHKDAINQSFFGKFIGEGADSIVQRKMQLGKMGGDSVTFGFSPKMAATAIVNGTLEGQETAIINYTDSVTLDSHRQAVRDDGKLGHIQAFFDLGGLLETEIRDWQTEYIDALSFASLLSSTNANNYYTAGKTSVNGLVAGSVLNAAELSKLHASALTGNSRTFTPLRPIKIGGQDYFVLVTHPDCKVDLFSDDDFRTGLESAMPRSSDNPLFKSASLVRDNIIIYFDRRMPITTNSGSVPTCKSLLMGAQSLFMAMGQLPTFVKETFDYNYETGMACEMILGVKRPTFNDTAYGSVIVNSARTNVSGTSNTAEIDYTQYTNSNL